MRRLSKLFREDGNMVVVAMDHGLGLNVNPALDDIGAKLRAIVKGGADAILTTYGIARKYEDILKDVNLILRVDGGNSCLNNDDFCQDQMFDIEDALRVGADGIICMGFPGSSYEHQSLKQLADYCRKGDAMGIPVMAEMLPGGFSPAIPNTIENLVVAAHTGCECGAHIIKTAFAGDAESYKKVIAASFQPVIVLGGEAVSDLSSLYFCIEQAMTAGARGVAIGRNVWKSSDPEGVTRNLVRLVHEGAKAADIKA